MKKKSLFLMFALFGAVLLSGSLLTACSDEDNNGNEGGKEEGGTDPDPDPELNFDGSPYVTQVIDYRPAPGQFVNTMPSYEEGDTQETMNAKVLEAIGNGKKGMITLGAYGGYVIVGFDHTIQNVEGEKDFRIVGNAFTGSSEPGIIMVAYDKNQDGKPDADEWYELAGSEYGKNTTIKGYEITYFRNEKDHVPTPDLENYYSYGLVTKFIVGPQFRGAYRIPLRICSGNRRVPRQDKDIRSIAGRHFCFVCRHPDGTFRLHSRYTHPTFHP